MKEWGGLIEQSLLSMAVTWAVVPEGLEIKRMEMLSVVV